MVNRLSREVVSLRWDPEGDIDAGYLFPLVPLSTSSGGNSVISATEKLSSATEFEYKGWPSLTGEVFSPVELALR